MKAQDLARELAQLVADLEAAKAKGRVKALEYKPEADATTITAFEYAWMESQCKEAAARLRSIVAELAPKRTRRAA